MPEPTEEIRTKSAQGFFEKWQFPNCIGSVDGKHVTIKCPNNSRSRNFCYLKTFSVVLMAIVDPDYKFICIDVAGYGRNSDGGILEESIMGKRLEAGMLNVPEDKPLPDDNHETIEKKDTYNYRLCRARRVVENAFGILAKKWRVFESPMEMKETTVKKVIMATCILHNYLRVQNCNKYDNDLEADEEPFSIRNNIANNPGRYTVEAFGVRECFVEYFNNE
ncbi:hypothetical protein QTP88_008995 [Uroleucon formosanum]